MKNRKFFVTGMLALALTFVLVLPGCSMSGDDGGGSPPPKKEVFIVAYASGILALEKTGPDASGTFILKFNDETVVEGVYKLESGALNFYEDSNSTTPLLTLGNNSSDQKVITITAATLEKPNNGGTIAAGTTNPVEAGGNSQSGLGGGTTNIQVYQSSGSAEYSGNNLVVTGRLLSFEGGGYISGPIPIGFVVNGKLTLSLPNSVADAYLFFDEETGDKIASIELVEIEMVKDDYAADEAEYGGRPTGYFMYTPNGGNLTKGWNAYLSYAMSFKTLPGFYADGYKWRIK
jgi:hypothetical protein